MFYKRWFRVTSVAFQENKDRVEKDLKCPSCKKKRRRENTNKCSTYIFNSRSFNECCRKIAPKLREQYSMSWFLASAVADTRCICLSSACTLKSTNPIIELNENQMQILF